MQPERLELLEQELRDLRAAQQQAQIQSQTLGASTRRSTRQARTAWTLALILVPMGLAASLYRPVEAQDR
jgi:hypothetical protein